MTDIVIEGTMPAYLSEGARDGRKKGLLLRLYRTKLTYSIRSKKTKDKDKSAAVTAVPLLLLRVESEVTLSSLEGDLSSSHGPENRQFCFEITGPNLRVIVIASDAVEKKRWVGLLTMSHRATLRQFGYDEKDKGQRVKAAFTFAKIGDYEGQWLDCKFHGRGVFKSVSGDVFDGYWDSQLLAGFGSVHFGGETYKSIGWTFDNPFSKVDLSSNLVHVDSLPHDIHTSKGFGVDFTDDELEYLLTFGGNERLEFRRGDLILKEGDANTKLFRILSGKVRFANKRCALLEVFSAPHIFGEMSIFDKRTNLCDVIAETDCVLVSLTSALINKQLRANPKFYHRFHYFLAKSFALHFEMLRKTGILKLQYSVRQLQTPTHAIVPTEGSPTRSSSVMSFKSSKGSREKETPFLLNIISPSEDDDDLRQKALSVRGESPMKERSQRMSKSKSASSMLDLVNPEVKAKYGLKGKGKSGQVQDMRASAAAELTSGSSRTAATTVPAAPTVKVAAAAHSSPVAYPAPAAAAAARTPATALAPAPASPKREREPEPPAVTRLSASQGISNRESSDEASPVHTPKRRSISTSSAESVNTDVSAPLATIDSQNHSTTNKSHTAEDFLSPDEVTNQEGLRSKHLPKSKSEGEHENSAEPDEDPKVILTSSGNSITVSHEGSQSSTDAATKSSDGKDQSEMPKASSSAPISIEANKAAAHDHVEQHDPALSTTEAVVRKTAEPDGSSKPAVKDSTETHRRSASSHDREKEKEKEREKDKESRDKKAKKQSRKSAIITTARKISTNVKGKGKKEERSDWSVSESAADESKSVQMAPELNTRRPSQDDADLVNVKVRELRLQREAKESTMDLTDWPVEWSEGAFLDVMNHFSEDVIYRDPFAPQGIEGKETLRSHLHFLFQMWDAWNWNVVEIIPAGPSFSFIKAILKVSSRFNEAVMIHLKKGEDKKILMAEVFYDSFNIRTEDKAPDTARKGKSRPKEWIMERIPKLEKSQSSPTKSQAISSPVDSRKRLESQSTVPDPPTPHKGDEESRKGLQAAFNFRNRSKSKADGPRASQDAAPSTHASTSDPATPQVNSQTLSNSILNNSNYSPMSTPLMLSSFGLEASESVIVQLPCYFIRKLNAKKRGTLFITAKHVCFGTEQGDGLEIFPINYIEKHKLKENERGIYLKINSKDARKVNANVSLSKDSFSIVLDTKNECAEVMRLLGDLHEVVDAPPIEGHQDEYNPAKTFEKMMEKAQASINTLPVRFSKSLSPVGAIRVRGPNPEGTRTVLHEDIYGFATSLYPRVVIADRDGRAQITDRLQGDPICDQFCVERFPSHSIVAIADGCNWGPKPRDAAIAASRTFVEFAKNKICAEDQQLTLPQIASVFVEAFAQAHHKIMEGHEGPKVAHEVGTTTLLGGCIIPLAPMSSAHPPSPRHLTDSPSITVTTTNGTASSSLSSANVAQHPSYAFVCVGLGDCKAYHISLKDGRAVDITRSARGDVGALDARDSGGRLGPYKKTAPDLRNLSAYYRALEEGDFVILVSDGVYDNLDPQALGVDPTELGLPAVSAWEDFEKAEVDVLKRVELAKAEFSSKKLSSLITEAAEEAKVHLSKLKASHILDKVISYCTKTTANMRNWMESNPNDIQPKDAKNYPGKVDHTTCVVLKVAPSRFDSEESLLDNLVVRMRHPTSGVNEETEGTQQVSFMGSDLVEWLKKNAASLRLKESAEEVAQMLMNFGYMDVVTSSDSFIYESFHSDCLYRFTTAEPILNKKDWEILTNGASKKVFEKGEVIVEEKSHISGVYQVIVGSCRMEMSDRKFYKAHPSDNALFRSDTIATIGVLETFGESSILLNGTSPVQIIANDRCEALLIEADYLKCMFVRYPDMAGRFYQFLAAVLSRRVYHILCETHDSEL